MDDLDLEDEEDAAKPLAKTADNQAAEADKVTDFAEEKENEVEETTLQEAMAVIAKTAAEEKAAQDKREAELAAVKINRGDIKVIADEMEVDDDTAETKLREAGGDVIKALQGMIA